MILNVVDCLKQPDGCVTVKRITCVPHFEQALEIGRQSDSLLHEEDEAPTIQGHRSADFD